MVDTKQLEFLRRCRDDLEFYAAQCLRIRDKSGNTVPLVFNSAQRELHRRLEEQKSKHGWVRAIVLKGRQQGISTYVAARFYWRTSLRKGINTYILSHEQTASDNLFSMVDRFQRNNPLAPRVGASNIKELVFDILDSSYSVATAGAKAGGRSRTISLFHGSEVAFWPNAKDHFAASVQAVPLLPDTEIILESTSNGAGGELYERWQKAEAEANDYMPVFLEWYRQEEYKRPAPYGFQLQADADEGEMSEVEYAEAFKLSDDQMAWRRAKIDELGSQLLFHREYPATPAEAWTSPPDHEPFIKPLYVLRARKNRTIEGYGPLILGVDPAGMGGDRFSVAARRGQQVLWTQYRLKLDPEEGKLWVRSLIDEHHPARVNIDAGNMGGAIISGLRLIGPEYARIVRAVNFGATAQCKLAQPKVPGPANRRAEMWARCRDWLMAPEGARLPDDDALQSDLTAPKLKPRLNGDYVLESKEEMKKRQVRSPDLGDGVVLTFAFLEHILEYDTPKAPRVFGDVDPPRNSGVSQRELPIVRGPTGWMMI